MVGEPPLGTGVGVVRDHEVTPGERRRDVDLRARRRLVRLVHGFTRAKQRLGRDARPVRALATHELAFDHGDAQTALRQRAGAVLAGRPRAKHDDVVVGHDGSSSPACSATMYAAYQSGQFASRCTGALLVFAVGGLRTPKRARQVRRGRECGLSGVDPAGQPRRDLLQQPVVAVRIAERGEGGVGGVIGRGAAEASARAVGLELRARRPGVEHLADLDAVRHEIVARGLDVGDDQVQALGRAGFGRRHVRAELNGAPRAGRCELDDPEAVLEGEVGVEPPPEARVELLRPVDVRDGDDDDFELHVESPDVRVAGRVTRDFGGAHDCLPGVVSGNDRRVPPTASQGWNGRSASEKAVGRRQRRRPGRQMAPTSAPPPSPHRCGLRWP